MTGLGPLDMPRLFYPIKFLLRLEYLAIQGFTSTETSTIGLLAAETTSQLVDEAVEPQSLNFSV